MKFDFEQRQRLNEFEECDVEALAEMLVEAEAKIAQLRTERNRLRDALRRVCSHEGAWDRLPMSLQDEAASALTQQEDTND